MYCMRNIKKLEAFKLMLPQGFQINDNPISDYDLLG